MGNCVIFPWKPKVSIWQLVYQPSMSCFSFFILYYWVNLILWRISFICVFWSMRRVDIWYITITKSLLRVIVLFRRLKVMFFISFSFSNFALSLDGCTVVGPVSLIAVDIMVLNDLTIWVIWDRIIIHMYHFSAKWPNIR